MVWDERYFLLCDLRAFARNVFLWPGPVQGPNILWDSRKGAKIARKENTWQAPKAVPSVGSISPIKNAL
jgi:hypothetical protein